MLIPQPNFGNEILDARPPISFTAAFRALSTVRHMAWVPVTAAIVSILMW
jgi:hypothetical protein